MRRCILLGIAIFAVFGILGLGFMLWWPPEAKPDRSSDLGATLIGGVIGGALVASAALYLETRLSRATEKRDLKIQLGLQGSLAKVDLSDRDLSGFKLPGRDLSHAILTNANLRGANLSGANLSHAILDGADLRGAKLVQTGLKPRVGLKPGKGLKPSSTDKAVITTPDTRFVDAKYDSTTECPTD